jgi:outer membrane protein OmpA-like peptidoglycan-associated protein
MSRMPFNIVVLALIVAACSPAASAVAQTPTHVRVVKGPAPIQRWLRAPVEVLRQVEPGTTLEVLDTERGWLWVIIPADGYGTRRAGWIRGDAIEPVPPPVAMAPQHAADEPEPHAASAPVSEDAVTITERRDDVDAPPASRAYSFDDVHFDRDRDVLRPADMDRLRAAVTALQEDPSLVVNIEGHTCSLGAAAYNRALGLRRASAVKAFLVRAGIAAERLHTVTRGEEHPEHDNAHEETRRLNRRVALVPDAQP